MLATFGGTSFSKEDIELPLPAPSTASPELSSSKTRPKQSRLSRLFGKKKTVESKDVVVQSAAETSKIPTVCLAATTSATPPESQLIVDAGDNDSADAVKNVIPKPNGFVDTVMSAYNQHHALVLRPDDVWIAILTQFNFFINARAELLRANFVAHDDKTALVVERDAFDDFEVFALEMASLIERNVVDPSLRSWALPAFSTTTPTDTAVGAMVLMATLKAFFEYVYCAICCGIPRVTLAGEKSDWEEIRARLEKLKEYGLETIAWYHLLVPVVSRFVAAFDDPNGPSNIAFWKNVAHFEPEGSGPSYYSGWITAFCVFSDKGRWLGPPLKNDVRSMRAPESMTAARFWNVYGDNGVTWLMSMSELTIDDTPFHKIDCSNIPPSYAEVDVRLVSEGKDQQCAIAAGVVGMRVCSSKDTRLSESGKDDTVRPAVGWWLFNKI
ncbi:hypothetical protein MVEN_01658100 [Mycena venus]|uniref:Uncharacterized protein n=1 Tax=Mycena venus TaxID=2733690 RepID=A0A8H6XNE6_9AGAR|nr:hypothetical protein MVEN_01658100 [Mycena venus]